MMAGDLFVVLQDYKDSRLVINTPQGRMVVQKVAVRGDGDSEVHLDLAPSVYPAAMDPAGWQPDATGV